jgi:hypothetical protein
MQRENPATRPGRRIVLGGAVALALGVVVCGHAGGTLRTLPVGMRGAGPLPLSLQNEVDAAIDRGLAWLAACQDPDGSWAGSNRVDQTAAAMVALSAGLSASSTSAAARAWAWLEHQTNTADRVWPRLARAVRAKEASEADAACRALAETWCPPGCGPAPDGDWPRLWLEARVRNVAPDAAHPPPPDWRRNLARQIVNSQLAAPDRPGTGFWKASREDPADWRTQPVARTCFALLALLEL